MRPFQGDHSGSSVGNDWEHEGRTENEAEKVEKRREHKVQLGDLGKSINKKSPRLQFGGW